MKIALTLLLLGLSAPANFAFVRSGQTIDEVTARLGKPTADYPAWVVDGEIDPFVGFASPASLRTLHAKAKTEKKAVTKVRVVEWRLERELAKIVLVDDRVWYAVLPAPDSQRRDGAKTSRLTETTGDVKRAWTMHAWSDRGEALLFPDGEQSAQLRLVFPSARSR